MRIEGQYTFDGPREVLWEIARLAPRSPAELEAIIAPLHWRFREYGGEILRLLWG